MPHLQSYGWNPHFASQLALGETVDQVARVVQEHKEAYLVRPAALNMGNFWAEISGKIRHHATVRADFPAGLVTGLPACSPSTLNDPPKPLLPAGKKPFGKRQT